ncbi:acylphosphatase [Selenomonas sp. oral taxon 138]|uniref:acylphosphatase n=1 Tax=Selenomonas sp. oral taxon 138 TaxID=712532 RepID=UPI0002A44EC7|nr:acylphosphatase [Selenomonas sp. oral taxon 138]EKY01848.1 acylphosphatase [Selenomonas sp. oral taxon 138 str. F0429]
MSDVIRHYACAAGRVQGVGFRMFVRQQAVMNDITGWVMNMSDGTVTMELQGKASAVEAAFAAMRTGNYFIRVERLDIEEREPVDGERDFSIKY